MSATTQPLFGLPSHPWPTFRPINDQVRGGSSTSSFTSLGSTNTALFAGHLDTKTLGGAGFASQCTTFHPRLCFPSPPSRGLYLTLRRPPAIPDSQPTSFVLSLKNDEPEDRENGRRGSVMHYEWSFDVRAQAEGVFTIEAEWKDFKGTFRGREDKEAPNLDPTSIYELSFMCRSNFNQQFGDFSLEIVSVGVVNGLVKSSVWTRWTSGGWLWLSQRFATLARWWRGDRGLRLPD